jgi:hypothetical protein
VRAAQDGGVQHPRELDVGGVDRGAGRALDAVDTRGRLPHDRARPGRPLVERVLVDHDPLLGEPALDLLLGADQSRQLRIASSIFG